MVRRRSSRQRRAPSFSARRSLPLPVRRSSLVSPLYRPNFRPLTLTNPHVFLERKSYNTFPISKSLFSRRNLSRSAPAGARPGSQKVRKTARYVNPTFSVGEIRRAVICAKRGVRKEVMHALGHAGGSGQRSPRFNRSSSVRC